MTARARQETRRVTSGTTRIMNPASGFTYARAQVDGDRRRRARPRSTPFHESLGFSIRSGGDVSAVIYMYELDLTHRKERNDCQDLAGLDLSRGR
jgi:hypothetical protein